MTSDDFPHHRRFPRIASHHSVLVKKLGGDSPLEEFAQTKTIAVGGCSFVSLEPLGFDSQLELLIAVEHRVIHAPGRVVYERDLGEGRFEVGVEFSDRLEVGDSERIASLFEKTAAEG